VLRKEIDSGSTSRSQLLDGARRHHRPADPGQADPGNRLGVPPGARGRDDAPAGAAPRGILPLDTVESIWRVIISTFTYVQAPFSVHADISAGESAMRDSARFHFGFTVPYVSHFSAPARSRRWRNRRAIWRWSPRPPAARPWWIALEADGAPKIIARLPFVERADHPAALPVFVVSRVADSAMVTEVEMWSVRVSGWNAETARALSPLAEIVAVPDTAFDGAALLVSLSQGPRASSRSNRPDRGRRHGALIGPRRQPRNALYGAPERGGQELKPPPKIRS
jgi:hypothetical protein